LSFLRTSRGLSNLHLFFGVDAVVYVEGGAPGLTLDDFEQGRFNSYALDIAFWETVIGYFRPGRKYAIRAAGVKTTVLQLASLVASNQVTRLIVAMDRDLDNWRNQIVRHPAVLYTWGYSWENDVWHDYQADVFFAVCPIPRTNSPVGQEITGRSKIFATSLNRLVIADVLLANANMPGTPKGCGERLIETTRSGEPLPNKAQARQLLKQALAGRGRGQNRIRVTKMKRKAEFWRDCQGHAIGLFFFRLFSHLKDRLGGRPRLTKEQVSMAALQVFRAQVLARPTLPISIYYAQMCSSLPY
jgi:hypothetical protein